MADNMNDMEHGNDTEALLSRRAVLKVIAGAPLIVTFGLATSPLMRFLKPTMKPGNFIQAADLPAADQPVQFHRGDFPDTWTCLPFMFPMKVLVFNPEQCEIRKIPGFVIRVENNQIIAFSRKCPKQGDHVLNYVSDPVNHCCGGCPGKTVHCQCAAALSMASLRIKTPVLVCPCDGSIFDLSNNGRVLAGPACRPPRQFTVNVDDDLISINRLEAGGIA